MRHLVFGSVIWLVGSCGGGGDVAPVDGSPVAIDAADVDAPGVDAPVDAAPDAWLGACSPLAPPGQQGCLTGEKCTWIQVQDTPETLGRLGFVPDGVGGEYADCTHGAVGETTGYDDCAAGLICVGGSCRDICSFDGSIGAACAAGFNCTRYSGLFANGDDDPVAGACNPGCSPITQLRPDGTSCGVNMGCYVLVSQTDSIAVCAVAGSVMHGAAITGTAYANSCVPGAQPRRREPSTTTVECGGLCQIIDVTSTINMASEGGVAPDSCLQRWGAAPPSDTIQGESCRYWWAREPFDTLSPFSNTLGWCFKHSAFLYDSNSDQAPDLPFPRCTDLTTGDVVPPIGNPPHNDAAYFWCVTSPAMLTGAVHAIKRAQAAGPRFDRLGGWR